MTTEELNTALYQKMFEEQKDFAEWLLTQPLEEILAFSYEYSTRQDILLSLEYNDLTDKQCKALLKSPTPLSDLFHEFEKRETAHMDEILSTIESHANAIIRRDFLQKQRESR